VNTVKVAATELPEIQLIRFRHYNSLICLALYNDASSAIEVREGAPKRQDSNFEKKISGQMSKIWARHQDILTD
jgi:hypothetical protein